MARRRDEGWTWLDWLGLIIYLAAWYVVLRSMLIPSQFMIGSYEIRLSGIGLLGAVSLGIILLAVLFSGFKFRWALAALLVLLFFLTVPTKAYPVSSEECPISIYAKDSNGSELILQNGSSYPNLVEFALVHKAKEGSHGNLCDDWKQILDAFCCWYGGCRSFYSDEEGLFTLKVYPISNRTFLLIDEGLDSMFRVEVKFGTDFTYRCEDLGSPRDRRDRIQWAIALLVSSGVLAYIARLWSETRRGKPRGPPYHG